MAVPVNVLTIDLEDWHQLAQRRCRGRAVPVSPDVVANTDRLLRHLARARVTATFFVVGCVAQAFPDLIRRIHDLGHEIASHGHEHHRVDGMGPTAFAADLGRSIDVLTGITGGAVAGFRAPEFSITGCEWYLDELIRAGLRYDSSLVPAARRAYGTANAPTQPHTIHRDEGALVELPIATAGLLGRTVPAGGGYLRLMGARRAVQGIRRLNRRGTPAVVFVHPHEVAPGRLRLRGVRGARTRLWDARRNLRRGPPLERTLCELLDAFNFARAVDVADALAVQR